jgi:hypothetical protein
LKRIQDYISRLEHTIEADEKEKARIIAKDESNNDASKVSSNESTSHHMKQEKKRKIVN